MYELERCLWCIHLNPPCFLWVSAIYRRLIECIPTPSIVFEEKIVFLKEAAIQTGFSESSPRILSLLLIS